MEYEIIVGPRELSVSPPLRGELLDLVHRKFRYRVDNYQYTKAHTKGGWDGYKYIFHRNNKAPSGCFRKLANILESEGCKVDVNFIIDYTPVGSGKIFHLKQSQLDDFQKKAPEKAVNNRFCIIKAPPRAGKTAVIGMIIKRIEHYPVLVITNSEKDVVRQIREKLHLYLKEPIGVFSEGEFEVENVVVSHYGAFDSVFNYIDKNKDRPKPSFSLKGLPKQNSDRMKEIKKRFRQLRIAERNERILDFIKNTKVLLLDECHHALSDSFDNVLKNCDSIGYRIGTSATPQPNRSSMIELEAKIGPIITKVKFETLIKSGRLTQPVVIVYELPQSWYTRHLVEYDEIYEANIVQNTRRNEFIAEIVKKLKQQNKTSFITVTKLEHGRLLRSLIPNSFFVNHKTSTDTRMEVYNSLMGKKIHCVITTIGKEALDLPRLDAIINAEGHESKVLTIQRLRSLTAAEGKETGLVIDFIDGGKYLLASSYKRRNIYSKIKGFIVKNKKVRKDYKE